MVNIFSSPRCSFLSGSDKPSLCTGPVDVSQAAHGRRLTMIAASVLVLLVLVYLVGWLRFRKWKTLMGHFGHACCCFFRAGQTQEWFLRVSSGVFGNVLVAGGTFSQD